MSPRLLFVVTDLHRGGAEAMLFELAIRLHRHRYDVHVMSLGGEGAFGDRFRDHGITVTSLELGARASSVSGLARAMATLRRLDPQVVQGWMYHGNVAASLLATGRMPVYWSIHYSLDDIRRDPPLTRNLIRHGHRLRRGRVRGIAYCSRRSARQHEALGYPAALTAIIPNAVDLDRYRSDPEARERARVALGATGDEFLVGMFAHWRPMKDHATMLAAFARAVRGGTRARLLLGGRGITMDNVALRELIRAHDVLGFVDVLGERHDLPALLPGLDAACLSSAWGEAFPVVLAEAMASGVPCVATDVGDSAEVLGLTGVITPPNDVAAFAAGLERMLALPPAKRRELGDAARARVQALFNMDRYVASYADLYERQAPGRHR